jgi:hypothetical protein
LIGAADGFEQALEQAVLARLAVKIEKGEVGLGRRLRKPVKLAAGIEKGYPMAELKQGGMYGPSPGQGHLPLIGPAAAQ